MNPISQELLPEASAPTTEPQRQEFFMQLAAQIVAQRATELGHPLTAHVKTYGCQMNERDSEKLRGILLQIGYQIVEEEDADLVLLNTCTVRENANLKVYGRLGYLGGLKQKREGMIIALCGCMMQEPEVVETIKKSYRFVDLIFGTHNIYKFAELVYQTLNRDYLLGQTHKSDRMPDAMHKSGQGLDQAHKSDHMPDAMHKSDRMLDQAHKSDRMLDQAHKSDRMLIDVWKDTDQIVEDLPAQRTYSFKSGVNIMFGCNNFCTYCIVPYVRGRERSRHPRDIIREIERLVADGVVEIMLLGQNVNSYGKNLDEPVTFAQLLRMVEQIEGLERIRFMTSHPKDLSDELIEVMASSKKICPHLHLPLQSGSSRLLAKMNRHYTKEGYLDLCRRLREKMPDLSLTTDIIVGFPGETEEDFLETMDVVEQVRYDSAFTFIYSRRTGTPAAVMEDQIPKDVIKDRFDRLLERVQQIGRERSMRFEGQTMPVLVEHINEQDASLVTGRLANNLVVHFPGDESLIGKIVDVYLEECRGFYYLGRRA